MDGAMRAAFVKAGIPQSGVSFAAACHDLAVLALNREPDPSRAASVWIGMAARSDFKAVLVEFLAGVQSGTLTSPGREDQPIAGAKDAQVPSVSRSGGPVSAEGQSKVGASDAQVLGAPAGPLTPPRAASETASDVGHALRGANDAQSERVPSDAVNETPGRTDHSIRASDGQIKPVPRPGAPNAVAIKAATEARMRNARVLSGAVITDRQGSVIAIEDIAIAAAARIKRQIGRRTVKSAREFYLLDEIEKRLPAYSPMGATVADCFGASEVAEFVRRSEERAALLFMDPTERELIGSTTQ